MNERQRVLHEEIEVRESKQISSSWAACKWEEQNRKEGASALLVASINS